MNRSLRSLDTTLRCELELVKRPMENFDDLIQMNEIRV